MTTIANPVYRVLEVADPEEIDQPKPVGEFDAFSSLDLVPVTEPCERCGCHWIGDPEAFIPEGNAECAYCRMWRGSVHRNASLGEFSDDEAAASIESGDDPQGGTLEAVMSEGIPVYDPQAMGVDDEDAVGIVDVIRDGGDDD